MEVVPFFLRCQHLTAFKGRCWHATDQARSATANTHLSFFDISDGHENATPIRGTPLACKIYFHCYHQLRPEKRRNVMTLEDQPESEEYEEKSNATWNQDQDYKILKTLIAFANGQGGSITIKNVLAAAKQSIHLVLMTH
ncbi:hypothetical protein [Marimonas lutisalis]|uniref:hypothetical protein n=1 Tax=Marimonas lutisalis TaxID=2545756 RepID=UPI00195F8B89|nr:hypothetical protein [Marimonas lutisalis]